MLDAAVLNASRVFGDRACTPADGERANDADLAAFASLAGSPAVTPPMGTLPDGLPVGLQLADRPGADPRYRSSPASVPPSSPPRCGSSRVAILYKP